MLTFWKNLIVASMLTSYGCAHVASPAASLPVLMYVDKGFVPIDSDNPPTDGVWASWDDAKALANNNRLERLELAGRNIDLDAQNHLLQKKLQAKEEEAIQLSSGWRSWLAHWGIPIGLLCGFGLGIGIAIGVKK